MEGILDQRIGANVGMLQYDNLKGNPDEAAGESQLVSDFHLNLSFTLVRQGCQLRTLNDSYCQWCTPLPHLQVVVTRTWGQLQRFPVADATTVSQKRKTKINSPKICPC